MSNENKALELWRQWFEFSGNPYETNRDNIDLWCFFCGEREDHGHAKDCVYVRAAELLQAEWMGKINDECHIYSTAVKNLEEMREAETPIHELQGRISKACTSAVLGVLRDLT